MLLIVGKLTQVKCDFNEEQKFRKPKREIRPLIRGGYNELMPTAVALIKKDDRYKRIFC